MPSPGIRPAGSTARQRPAAGGRITASGCAASNCCLRTTGSTWPVPETGAQQPWPRAAHVVPSRARSARSRGAGGQIVEVTAARVNALDHLVMVRAFYLDLTQWAADDPARWGQWVVPCPVRAADVTQIGNARSRRKARMDQRTRERMPVLPALLAAVDGERRAAAERLCAAQGTAPGELLTAAGQTLRRSARPHASAGRIWADDPGTRQRRDLTLEEHRSFWTWAAVEVLRHTGVRIEELTELSHHSFIQYQLPATGELIPLLQIAPSKTDTERLLPIDRAGTGRCAQRDYLPDPRRGRGRAAGGRLRLPRTAVESADAAAVPAPLRRRRPPDRRPRGPRAHQRRPGQHWTNRRQRQAATFRSP